MKAQLTRKSGNEKTGPIPVSMTSDSTCPDACSLKQSGCYAKGWPLVTHWRKVEQRGTDWTSFCRQVASLPEGQLIRYNQAGDLPGEADCLDASQLRQLIVASAGKVAFTYTHKPVTHQAIGRMAKAQFEQGKRVSPEPTPEDHALMLQNRALVAEANLGGLTVNVSTESLSEADSLMGGLPTVTLLPMLEPGEREPKVTSTPQGRRVVTCPAQYRETSCDECRLCQRADRTYIIGFRAHGYARRRVSLKVVQ